MLAKSKIMQTNDNETLQVENLVLSGGGIRGIAFLGALALLEAKNILQGVTTFVGTSIGAMICALLCIGYTSSELLDFLNTINFKDIHQVNIFKLATHFGLDSGNTLVYLIEQLFVKKGFDEHITMSQLHNLTKKKLVITGTCVNQHSIKYFDYTTTPDVRVIDVIRISISVPILYTSPKFRGEFYVDGGILDNFPLHLFDDSSNVLALKLVKNECKSEDKVSIDNFEEWCVNLIYCLLDEIEFLRNDSCKYHQENSTIYINTKHFSSFRFNLSPSEKQELYNLGYDAAQKYFEKPKNDRSVTLDNSNVNGNVENVENDGNDGNVGNDENDGNDGNDGNVGSNGSTGNFENVGNDSIRIKSNVEAQIDEKI